MNKYKHTRLQKFLHRFTPSYLGCTRYSGEETKILKNMSFIVNDGFDAHIQLSDNEYSTISKWIQINANPKNTKELDTNNKIVYKVKYKKWFYNKEKNFYSLENALKFLFNEKTFKKFVEYNTKGSSFTKDYIPKELYNQYEHLFDADELGLL